MQLKTIIKHGYSLSIILFLFLFIGLTGCSQENKTPENQAKQVQENNKDTSIVRSKDVNVNSLDADKDGSLYQCEMDYDVISDKSGTCPKCGMELKKVSVADAKKNLDAYNSN